MQRYTCSNCYKNTLDEGFATVHLNVSSQEQPLVGCWGRGADGGCRSIAFAAFRGVCPRKETVFEPMQQLLGEMHALAGAVGGGGGGSSLCDAPVEQCQSLALQPFVLVPAQDVTIFRLIKTHPRTAATAESCPSRAHESWRTWRDPRQPPGQLHQPRRWVRWGGGRGGGSGSGSGWWLCDLRVLRLSAEDDRELVALEG